MNMLKTIFIAAILFAAAKSNALNYGASNNNDRPYFIVNDFMMFNPNYGGAYKAYRYGMGDGQLQLGTDNAAMTGVARNGVTLKGLMGDSGTAPHVGLGLCNMEGKFNTNNSFHNYYFWQPSLDLGMQAGHSHYVVFTGDVKVGGSMTNYYNLNNEPTYDVLHGLEASMVLLNIGVGADYSRFGDEERTVYFLSYLNKFRILSSDDRLDKSISISLREDLW